MDPTTVVDEVWVIRTGPAVKLFMQWDVAVPFIREKLLAGELVHIELAPVIGGPGEKENHYRDRR